MRYEHLYHLPNDFDSISVQIPGWSGDGHYIVHWRWSGYYDCVDVDVRSTDVAEVYGVDSNTFIFNRIDHCQYVDPDAIVTPCMNVLSDAQPCINALPGWMDTQRLGLNIVPIKNPASVYEAFEDQVNIPWNNPTCASSSWTRLLGTETQSVGSWSTWESNTNTQVGQMCTNVVSGYYEDQTWTFRRAVTACAGHPSCVGVAWNNVDGVSDPYTGEHSVMLCSTTSTRADAAYTSYFPSGLTTFGFRGRGIYILFST